MDFQSTAQQSRLVALIILAVYLTIAIAMLPRELKFLAGAKEPHRRRFTVLDAVFQVFVLAVLLPFIVTSMRAVGSWITVFIGLVGVPATAVWMGLSRYHYTLKILLNRQAIIRDTLDDVEMITDPEGSESD